MTKKITILILFTLIAVSASAQLFNFGRRSYYRNNPIKKHPAIGLGFAGTYFMGDIGSAEKGIIRPALALKADYRLTRTFAAEFNAAGGILAQKYTTPNYYLADFKSHFGHFSLNFRLHFDGIFNMKPHTIISPYLSAGFGFMFFSTRRNLYDEQGDPYTVTAEGLILNIDGDVVTRDNEYETKIDEDGEYAHNALILPIGAGIKFQFSEHFEVNLEGHVYYTDHDFIEGRLGYKQDPAGNWQPNPTNEDNDAYFMPTLTLMYSLGFNPKRRGRRPVPSIIPSF